MIQQSGSPLYRLYIPNITRLILLPRTSVSPIYDVHLVCSGARFTQLIEITIYAVYEIHDVCGPPHGSKHKALFARRSQSSRSLDSLELSEFLFHWLYFIEPCGPRPLMLAIDLLSFARTHE